MSSETAISRWLQDEMPRRGYPVGGRRSGGISRLAEDAGIPQASMSRIVNGGAEPGIDHLRKIGRTLGVPLNEMLIHAEMADESDFSDTEVRVYPNPAAPDSAAKVQVPPEVLDMLPDLEPYKQHIWLTPGLSVKQRATLLSLVRLLLDDFPGENEKLTAVLGVMRVLAYETKAPAPAP
jgi:transcriptional regulator with XRE-family HTH domain